MCLVDVIDSLGDRITRRPQSLKREELREITETVFGLDRHDLGLATLSQSPNVVTHGTGVGFHRNAPLRSGLRTGLALFFLFATMGTISFMGSMGVGLAFLFSGLLAQLICIYGYGLRTGDYLISPRYSILGILVFSGLVITSLIAGVETFLAAR